MGSRLIGKHIFQIQILRLFLLGIVFSVPSTTFGQCVIKSNDQACVDEPLSFSIQTSSTITSVAWNFGDGNTSALSTPFHRYTKAGTYTIKATTTYSGGSTCDTSKTITVYNAPLMNVQFASNSNFCLTSNKVCLLDSSTSGNSGVANSDRTVLWGDGGKTDTKYPQSGGNVCYNYNRDGKYTLTIETTNDKGCKTKEEIKVEILFDFVPIFDHYIFSEGCDSQKHVFKLDTSWEKHGSEIVGLDYDFNDGSTDTTTLGDSVFHTFYKSGKYNVTLTATLKNGCKPTYTKQIQVDLDRIEINHSKLDSVVCFPDHFEFNHPIVSGLSTRYTWTAYDKDFNILTAFGGSRNAFYFPDSPGKYYIGLQIKRNECISRMMYDSVESIGVKADALILNGSQCEPKDTVYFCNQSVLYGTSDVSYLWQFRDTTADACTTNTAKGQNINAHCNFSEDEHAKHLYKSRKCSEIWLTAMDNTHGCRDSNKFNVILGKPDLNDFRYITKKTCLGSRTGYGVDFELESCFGELHLNIDSACGKDMFEDFTTSTTYVKTCDTSRWVTIGVSALTGDEKVYRSCDTSDYFIDQNRLCADTLWIHNAYRIDVSPFPQFKHKAEGCIPTKLTGELFLKQQPNVRKMYFDWDDGQKDTIDIPFGTDSLPEFSHLYRRSGVYYPNVILETDSGCQENQRIERIVGFYNDYDFDPLICPGMTVKFSDTITYWEDTTQYWRDTLRPERIIWDWDGGIGPDSGYEVRARFDTAGTYMVRMVSVNKNGCSDTVIKPVVVAAVRAGIRDVTKKLVCDDIIQLLDSSSALPHRNDSLTLYYWDFGDGRTPSYLKHPFHYYGSFGTFEVQHIVENTIGCRDTATITIEIDGPVPQFDIITDTVACAPFTAEFKNNSLLAEDYIWYFGDSLSTANSLSTKSDSNVTFTYTKPGIYYIYLFAGDSVINPDNNNQTYYCSNVFPDTNQLAPAVRRIIILPTPEVDFIIDGKLCQNSVITLKDNSDTLYSHYRWFWASDSSTGPNKEQQITVKDTGSLNIWYKPIYTPTGPYQRACFDSISKQVPVFENSASFEFEKDAICPTYHFTSTVDDGTTITWDFGHPSSGDANISDEVHPSHSFAPDEGEFYVCMKSTTTDGCVDTSCRTVKSEHNFTMFIPNVITPDDDGLNDTYEIEMEGEDMYELSIYNRWGERIYHVSEDYPEDSEFNWNGTVQNSGVKCPPGTYFYVLRFREGCIDDAEVETYNGTITVIR